MTYHVQFYRDMRRFEDSVSIIVDTGGDLYALVPKKIERGVERNTDTCAVVDTWDGPAPREFLQACVDEAFKLGIVPRQLPDYSGELKATKGWLQDMRLLAGVVPPLLRVKEGEACQVDTTSTPKQTGSLTT
jgi:hypothetical protein